MVHLDVIVSNHRVASSVASLTLAETCEIMTPEGVSGLSKDTLKVQDLRELCSQSIHNLSHPLKDF